VASCIDLTDDEGGRQSGLRAVPDSLHLRSAPTLTSSTCKSGMGFVELRGTRADVDVSERLRDDAFLVAVQLKHCPDFDLYVDERLFRHHGHDAGAVAIYDLRSNLLYDLRAQKASGVRDSFHALDFYLPRKALDALADDSGSPRIDELRHQPGMPIKDSVARALLQSIQPTLAAPPLERNELFVDHVAMALATHVAYTYGGMRPRPVASIGSLAPWQERRAKELLAANLAANITLDDLARECKLSIRHFTRAFRGSTRMSPHAWLLHHRVEKAKGLLIDSPRVLSDVALDCGFADQSHFTRTFQRVVGISPGAWRRLHRR
jgi:AraC family transcriptional regulator